MARFGPGQASALLVGLLVSAVAGAALFRLPSWVVVWSKEVAALSWLAGPLLLGFLLGRWLPGRKGAIALSSITISLVSTIAEFLRMKSNIWPFALATLVFWAGLVLLGATFGSRHRAQSVPASGE